MPSTASAIGLKFDQAIDYFRQKVNVPSAHWTALMDEAHARGFAVAGATSDALVADFRKAVDTAIAEGTGFGAFKKEFDRIVAKHGWQHTGHPQWRARIIYDTNLSTAFAAGRYAQLTNPAVLQAFPYWRYDHTPCQHPRLQHLAWDGLVLRADDPFWNTNYPPNGWGCRCRVSPTSQSDLTRMGKSGPDPSPKLEWRDYINKTTGVVVRVPTGCDPGWAYNPGKAWKEGAQQPVRAERVKPMGAPLPVLAPAGKTSVEPAVLSRFLDSPIDAVQIGAIDAHLAHALRAGTDRVLLSAATMKKQAARHPEIERKVYAAIESIITKPELVLDDSRDRQIWLFAVAADEVVRAVLKSTADGQEVYVVSVHRVGEKGLERMLRAAVTICGKPGHLLALLRKKRVR
jgi:hypothetical protein